LSTPQKRPNPTQQQEEKKLDDDGSMKHVHDSPSLPIKKKPRLDGSEDDVVSLDKQTEKEEEEEDLHGMSPETTTPVTLNQSSAAAISSVAAVTAVPVSQTISNVDRDGSVSTSNAVIAESLDNNDNFEMEEDSVTKVLFTVQQQHDKTSRKPPPQSSFTTTAAAAALSQESSTNRKNKDESDSDDDDMTDGVVPGITTTPNNLHSTHDQAINISTQVLQNIQALLDTNHPWFCSQERHDEWKQEISELVQSSPPHTIIGVLGNTGKCHGGSSDGGMGAK
jgi:hypothetical protein